MAQGTSSALPPAGQTLLTRLSQLQSALSPKQLPEGLLDDNMTAYTAAALSTGTGGTARAPEVGAVSVALAQAVVQTGAGTDDPLGDRSTLLSAPQPDLLAMGCCSASMQVDPPAHMSLTAVVLTQQAGCLPLLSQCAIAAVAKL